MSIAEYLRVAMAQLRRATLEERQEAQKQRLGIDTMARQMEKEIAEMGNTLRSLERDLLNPIRTSTEKVQIHRMLDDTRRQTEDKKHLFEELKARMNQEAKNKELFADQLDRQANDLERTASQFG